jgi:predicted metalloendopeptidase
MKIYNRLLAALMATAAILSCQKEPVSNTDPRPIPHEDYKDKSVQPGDSFFDYCNGGWISSHGIPATGAIGGAYGADAAMQERVAALKKEDANLAAFYKLMDEIWDHPEETKAFIQARKDKYPMPATKEEAFRQVGKAVMDGYLPLLFAFEIVRREDTGEWAATLIPALGISMPTDKLQEYLENANLVPAVQVKGGSSALDCIIEGMGIDPGQVYVEEVIISRFQEMESKSIEEIHKAIMDEIDYDAVFVSEADASAAGRDKKSLQAKADEYIGYTLSYAFAGKHLTEEFKQKYLAICQEVKASLRKRILNVDWMAQTTKDNALEKLDAMGINCAYPDQWYEDCLPDITGSKSLLEATSALIAAKRALYKRLIGTKDTFSYMIAGTSITSSGTRMRTDLTLANAFYSPAYNDITIYPALLMEPVMLSGYTDAYDYGVFTIIGHEFTHGFDTQGSTYDKMGRQKNWWTVADKMTFDERAGNLINCYDHLELEPGVSGRSGYYGLGENTITENIADLGGFLTVLDAYKAHLEALGFFGSAMTDQLKKFYESYASVWCIQYSDEKFLTFTSQVKSPDVHSHARLRVNGVVMNTDLWYELYGVNRNHKLYLPKERRAYIW